MAKKKRRSNRPNVRSILSKQLADHLSKAQSLVSRKRWPEAIELLEQLQTKYPRREEILILRLDVATQMRDSRTHLKISRQLVELMPNNVEIQALLGGSYMASDRPALSLLTFQNLLERWPNHPEATEAGRIIAKIQPVIQETLRDIGLDGPDGLRLAASHEQIQIHLEAAEFAAAQRVAEQLLAVRPNFAPALNNLALACSYDGNYARAVETSRRVLTFDADNIHALSNLTRYLYLGGQTTEADETARRLRTLTPQRPNEWVKIVETLAALGDDAGVEETARRARASAHMPEGEEAALLEHLAAVAAYRLDRPDEARQLWQTSLRHQSGFALAKTNLDDLRQPVELRHAAWPFELSYWLPRKLSDQLLSQLKSAQSARSDKAIQMKMQTFLRCHPHLERLVPILLERGDPTGRNWAMQVARTAGTPSMYAALRDFALSRRGPDELRMEASRDAQEAGVFPSGLVPMWIRGERREILLLSFEVIDEPERKHDPEVEKLAVQALEALKADRGQRAESLLRAALEKEPNAPDLLNNLAMAYLLQDRVQQGEELILQIHARFPDYFFGIIGAARIAIHGGRIHEAGDLLRPLLQMSKFHTSEFAALAAIEIELQTVRGEHEGARSWLKMWEDLTPDHPDLIVWRERLKRPSLWKRL